MEIKIKRDSPIPAHGTMEAAGYDIAATGKAKRKRGSLNCTCAICGKRFHRKNSDLKNVKYVHCSKECLYEHKKILMSGSGNHQYGLKGNKNSSWKSDERVSSLGYKLIRVLDHPFRNHDDMVFEHRLIAEKYLLTEENSIEINGKRYLKKEYAVHHMDLDRTNNSVENLIVLRKEQHTSLHNHLNKMVRNKKTGRFESFSKAEMVRTQKEIADITNDFLAKEAIA